MIPSSWWSVGSLQKKEKIEKKEKEINYIQWQICCYRCSFFLYFLGGGAFLEGAEMKVQVGKATPLLSLPSGS